MVNFLLIGKMSLMPAHTLEWYEIQDIFSVSLLIQNIVAICCCYTSYRARNMISDIIKEESPLDVSQFEIGN